jgi:hypothetical protein
MIPYEAPPSPLSAQRLSRSISECGHFLAGQRIAPTVAVGTQLPAQPSAKATTREGMTSDMTKK